MVCLPETLFLNSQQISSALLAWASQIFQYSGVNPLNKPKSLEHSEIYKDREVYLNLQM
jgi:hypothetical protein